VVPPFRINVTVADASKFAPLIVIVVPPSPEKFDGDELLTTGGGATPCHPSQVNCSIKHKSVLYLTIPTAGLAGL
jgi:hypothetical protein